MGQPTIIITGATGGLGSTLTQTLLAAGGHVTAFERRQSSIERFAATLDPDQADRFRGLVVDVSDEASVVAAMAAATEERELGGAAHLVGGYAGGPTIDQSSLEDFDRLFSVNVRAAFLIVREAARRFKVQGSGGAVVCVGSMSGRSGQAGHAAYAASKAALHALVRSAAVDLAPELIRVNAVLPTTIATAANLSAMPEADHGQWVTPQHVSDTIAFLLGPGASHLTGACIEVAGRSYQPG